MKTNTFSEIIRLNNRCLSRLLDKQKEYEYPATNKKETKMKKCEWEEFHIRENAMEWTTEYKEGFGLIVKYRNKPEPEVIIKKSCGTWVARVNGVDYLCVDPKSMVNIESNVSFEAMIAQGIVKPISEIEITDEIAKLRPMVKCSLGKHDSEMLIAVIDNEIFTDKNNNMLTTRFSLATVSDLED